MTFRERVARRRREQRRNLKKAAICAALVGIAAISIGLTSRPAADTHLVEITYTVQPGDTWWSIVEEFRDVDEDNRYIFDYEYDMEQLNKGVDLGNLTPGQTLRIQYHRRDGDHHAGEKSHGAELSLCR
jgi:nucleoid-associated protein YgaU